MKKSILILAAVVALAACRQNEKGFDASGVFEATEVIVSSEVSGKLMTFNLTEGDSVTCGQVVGCIDTVQLTLRVQQLRASIGGLDNRRTDVAKQIAVTEQQIATQQNERRRFEQLVKADAANQKQLDDINAAIALLQKQLDAQRTSLGSGNVALTDDARALRFQIAQLEDQIEKSRITSPTTGIVLAKYAEAGEMAAAGRPLFKVADMQHVYLRSYVTADQLTTLKLGQQVKVFADFGSDGYREYPGRITWMSMRSEFTPKNIHTRDERADLVYAMKVVVENDGYLKIGMYGQLKFE